MPPSHPLDRPVRFALRGGLPLMMLLLSLCAGVLALQLTPREEEPQIVVPMVDVLVEAPGLSARQVERQVTVPLEKLLTQIPGVEHLYSTSQQGFASATLRFHVGEDREVSILNTYNKLYSNQDRVPPIVSRWQIRPVEVDDVPILMLGLWSDDAQRYSDFELRRMAEEVAIRLQGIARTSQVEVVGGRPRVLQVHFDPESLAARKTTALDLVNALQLSNRLLQAGNWTLNNDSILLESGDFLRRPDQLASLVVNVVDGAPVYLRDVATLSDGPAEPDSYSWIDFTPRHPAYRPDAPYRPLVTLSVAKQRGSNAVGVAQAVHSRLAAIQAELLPPQVHLEVLRDYGRTADAKVDNLVSSLAFAVLTVVVFIGVFLGWRAALVVGLAVPICYGVTLALDMAFGYTINRVTLFALILSLGLLVDDPITGIDNIERYLERRNGGIADRIVGAMAEIRVPLLMSTLTIVLAFAPLAFITGMMGPYMAPMAFNVPVSVTVSTLVAFLVTPWLASRVLKPAAVRDDAAAAPDAYRRLLQPLLASRRRARWTLLVLLLLFVLTALMPLLRLVPLKLLPFDNRNEVQVLLDMPEGTSLEQTAAVTESLVQQVKRLPEVRAVAAYVGEPSPIDFNGMVRRYYQRQAPNLAELRLTLVDKSRRLHQSHAVVLRLRQLLAPFAHDGRLVKVVEVPPGPPVLSTLVAEVYGSELAPYELQQQAARQLMARLGREPHVVEVDSTLVAEQSRLRFVTDKQKAALSGIATDDINQTLRLANDGLVASWLNLPSETRPLPIELRLAQDQRGALSDFQRLHLKGRPGYVQLQGPAGLDSAPQPLVALGELGQFEPLVADAPIHHKDLRPVVYVMAELNGRTPAEVIADLEADRGGSDMAPTDWRARTFLSPGGGDSWSLPPGTEALWSGEGEWRITLRVFRDMGLAFAFALVAIFFVLRVQTGSAALSLIIMSAIPLTVIGIMPGFWLLNRFGERVIAGAPEPVLFTATAMIGMIALAGIVVRNSLILVEFISQARSRGLALHESLIQAGSVRMRPVLLTAGTTLLGNLVITLDPVFSGLALAIIFGIIASTLFTLLVIPIVYLLVFDRPEVAS
ncbi:acriflavine resistance protein B [Marinobacterium nitratireducens]|uniref:Acriflavine resistance protein B n=1 Tax=Marinobacterium nitratireducens TaxID=518897 RepID=A0A918DNG9_9GAMM|nr:efflux RND transporter permease subunit [Marinobacterium nitratireducens]GGO76691.1 acriflavine resistance protein B [Marinobacterium nitratireducens]